MLLNRKGYGAVWRWLRRQQVKKSYAFSVSEGHPARKAAGIAISGESLRPGYGIAACRCL